ncbi:hypothetical protein D1872_325230 [compost metagenome]
MLASEEKLFNVFEASLDFAINSSNVGTAASCSFTAALLLVGSLFAAVSDASLLPA